MGSQNKASNGALIEVAPIIMRATNAIILLLVLFGVEEKK